ncbi:MAG: 23S rRNA (pseudouridine(1915)-N(3))-methyltransferase RlmH [Lachnospiraceae bacterium]|nr:23S rRNA (pseudouridine(1915)-N(3))-methyltransferase RlmH [Lachnospiraceae bacterium]
MKTDIICVGKIKESFYRDAVKEYEKRLSRYVNLKIYEVADEKTDESASESENEKVLKTEAARILKHIRDDAFVITLEIKGLRLSSVELADRIKDLAVGGVSHLQFVIGGSLGLHEDVIKKSDLHLSFSEFTFPHQLMRVILLEQIYRAMKINAGEPYHK